MSVEVLKGGQKVYQQASATTTRATGCVPDISELVTLQHGASEVQNNHRERANQKRVVPARRPPIFGGPVKCLYATVTGRACHRG